MTYLIKNTTLAVLSVALFASCGNNEALKEEAKIYPVVAVVSRDIMAYQTYH